MTVVKLAGKVQADIRPALGSDEITALSIRVKMEAFLEDRPQTGVEYSFQAQFAMCIACTSWITGIEYKLPSQDDNGDVLADAYRAWINLPRRLFNAWRSAPDDVDGAFNDADLLPPDKVDEVTLKNLAPAVAE